MRITKRSSSSVPASPMLLGSEVGGDSPQTSVFQCTVLCRISSQRSSRVVYIRQVRLEIRPEFCEVSSDEVAGCRDRARKGRCRRRLLRWLSGRRSCHRRSVQNAEQARWRVRTAAQEIKSLWHHSITEPLFKASRVSAFHWK